MDSMSWLRGEPANLELVSQSDRHGKPLNTVVDKTTGLVRNDPIPSDEELERFIKTLIASNTRARRCRENARPCAISGAQPNLSGPIGISSSRLNAFWI